MKEEVSIYWKGRWITNPSKWILFRRKIKLWFKKWKLVDTNKYKLIPYDEIGRWFSLSEQEYNESERLYKEEHRTLSYEFYPCGGIGWGIKVHDLKTKETFDITSYDNW